MNETKPKSPIPSATIILGRDLEESIEIFMVKRHRQIDFAGGAIVFPGGRVDEDDMSTDLINRCEGVNKPQEPGIQYYVAAIREAYEESGILMARERNKPETVSAGRLAELGPMRRSLCANELKFSEFIKNEDLVLACDRLTPFAHWITPEIMPKRFNTWFFIADSPFGHGGEHDGHESVDSLWITPRKILDEASAGKLTVIFPTRMNITKLSRFSGLAEARQYCAENPIVTVKPWIEDRDGVPALCIPAEADYGITEEKIMDFAL